MSYCKIAASSSQVCVVDRSFMPCYNALAKNTRHTAGKIQTEVRAQ